MAIRVNPLRSQIESPTATWLSLLLTLYALLLVVGHSAGLLLTVQAIVMLLVPVLAVAISLRPAWVVLLILAVPAGFLRFVPTRGLVVLALATLLAQLVMRGRVHVDWRSGMIPIIAMLVVAYFYRADVSGEGPLLARGFLSLTAFWVALGLITYNAVRMKELNVKAVVVATLVGAVLTAVLEFTGIAGSAEAEVQGLTSIGAKLGYLAVISFTLCFGWLTLLKEQSPIVKGLLVVLALIFLAITAEQLVRSSWLAGLLFVLLASKWSGKKRYWILIPAVLATISVVPVARERVLPAAGSAVQRTFDVNNITTGRTKLWSILLEKEVFPALPAGNGYGHTFSLSAERIFGFADFHLDPDIDTFVYPHNDFIYWTIELGLFGFLSLVTFWIYLWIVFRRVTRGADQEARRSAYILSGIFLTMFAVQMIDNSFAIGTVSERFFIAAGFLFGLGAQPVHKMRSQQ